MAYADVDLGVITEARRRQRRRWALLVAVVLAAIAVTLAWKQQHHHAERPAVSRPAPIPSVAPHALFWQAPYMGVACSVPNSIGCDRVGVAVWLRRPAVGVTAWIAGKVVRLSTGPTSPSQWSNRPLRTGFTGYVQPAGLLTAFRVAPEPGTDTWLGAPTPAPIVTFRVDYGHGDVVATRQRVPLMAGWG
jgi:hypothetical protein